MTHLELKLTIETLLEILFVASNISSPDIPSQSSLLRSFVSKDSTRCLRHRRVPSGAVILQTTKLFLAANVVLLSGDVSSNPGSSTTTLSQDNLKVVYLNARSLKAFVRHSKESSTRVCKYVLLQDMVYSVDYDIVCICEAWLNNYVLSSELLPGYDIFRRDRQDIVGGGVLIAVKSNITSIGDIVRLAGWQYICLPSLRTST